VRLLSDRNWLCEQEQRTDEDGQHCEFPAFVVQSWPHRHVFQAIDADIQPLARIFAERLCATVFHSNYQGQRCRWKVVFFHSTFDLE